MMISWSWTHREVPNKQDFMYSYYTMEELRRLLASPRAQVAVFQNQLDEINRRLQLLRKEPSTPDNDAEYLKLITGKEAIEKRLEFATSQLLAEEDRETRKKEGGKKASQAKGRRGSGGRGGRKAKATDGKFARNVQIESDEENDK